MARISVGLPVLLGLILLAPASRADEELRRTEIKERREAVLGTVDNEVATKAYKNLFNNVNAAELAELTADLDIGIALYARWQCRKSNDPNLVAASHPERFAGFLEGRTGLKCPPNWVNWLILQSEFSNGAFIPGAIQLYEPLGIVTSREANGGAKSIASLGSTIERLQKTKLGSWQIQVPPGTRIQDGRIEVGKKSIPIHSSIISALRANRGMRSSEDVCRVLIDEPAAFAVFYCYGDESAPTLFCLDSTTGAVKWLSEGWARTGERSAFFGAWSHHPVELVTSRDFVAVFGVCGHYVEGFDIATGKAVFRFNPALWDGPVASYTRMRAEEDDPANR